jgi:hypothetical protein
MVIADFNVVSVVVFLPQEADSPPVVDPNAELPHPVSPESLETVSWGITEVGKDLGCIKDFELQTGSAFDFPESSYRLPVEKALSILVAKGLDHVYSL